MASCIYQENVMNKLATNIIKLLFLLMASMMWISIGQANQNNKNKYHNELVGFSVSKPDNWQFLKFEEAFETVGKALRDKEILEIEKQRFKKIIDSTKMNPVVMVKFPEPYPKINPTFQAYLEPYDLRENEVLIEFIKIYLMGQIKRNRYKELQIIAGPTIVNFHGKKGGYAEVYLKKGDEDIGLNIIKSRLWVIPRSQKAFVFIMFKPDDGNDFLDKEFEGILNSIRIE